MSVINAPIAILINKSLSVAMTSAVVARTVRLCAKTSSQGGWLIFLNETKLVLFWRISLDKALRAEAEQRRLDEA